MSATESEVNATYTPNRELVVLLVNGIFKVHAKGCKSIYRDRKKANNEFPFKAASRYETVAELWDDIINENVPEQYAIRYDAVVSYYNETDFHSCLADLPDGDPGRPEPETPAKAQSAKRAAKRELASLVVEAAARVMTLTPPAGMTEDDVAKAIAHWLHHLPADRERWVATGLPKPDRSDWR
jgi:hypothetical protein